jgi:hypothetical protein
MITKSLVWNKRLLGRVYEKVYLRKYLNRLLLISPEIKNQDHFSKTLKYFIRVLQGKKMKIENW